MPNDSNSHVRFELPGVEIASATQAMPQLLRNQSRGGGEGDVFFPSGLVSVAKAFDLTAPARGVEAKTLHEPDRGQVLALEAADGTTLFLRADMLAETMGRLYPDSVTEDGTVRLDYLRDTQAVSRGGAEWPWARLSVLTLQPDAIIDEAKAKALQWGREWLGDQVEGLKEQLVDFGMSWLASKALMWVIESRLAGRGLFPWRGGPLDGRERIVEGDAGLASAAKAGTLLVFLHGTASHTLGSFDALPKTGGQDWDKLVAQYEGRIYGFDHPSFSESPIENALALAKVLPSGARLHVVSHSRGGLVGDLLCMGEDAVNLVAQYRRKPPKGEKPWEALIRQRVEASEQAALTELLTTLQRKNVVVERYVRVAAPARGTTLLSGNLDVFLSGLLNLIGMVSGGAAHPAYRAFQRIVLEIAHNRVKPQAVPGIEAMLTDSPLTQFIGRAKRHRGTRMAVIAGDIEGGGLLKRLGVMFTDWMFFDNQDNDLVVDTESMFAGVARAPVDGPEHWARYLFLQGEDVHHFHYFGHPVSRSAVSKWLVEPILEKLEEFSPLDPRGAFAARDDARAAERGLARAARGFDVTRPVVVFLPGIMGSFLEIRRPDQQPGDGDRVWVQYLDLLFGGLEKIRYGKQNVAPERLYDKYYGDLASYLEDRHEVVRFPYDWRKPIEEEAMRLHGELRKLAARTAQPIRLLAHSMGGLVARAMMALDSQMPEEERVWEKLAKREGASFVMLGTPNNGSFLMVETLLGLSDTVRKLEKLDGAHGLQYVVDIVAGFPGALQLLPRPGFYLAGKKVDDYFQPGEWQALKSKNTDRWYDDGIGALPDSSLLSGARSLWSTLLKDNKVANAEITSYVFGMARATPCGIEEKSGTVKVVVSNQGDGSVPWESGRLDNLPASQCWYMPVDHAYLLGTSEYFEDISELLQRRRPRKLADSPFGLARDAVQGLTREPVFRACGAPPPVFPGEEELACRLMGGWAKRKASRTAIRGLSIGVKAMDLRFTVQPVLCGHYSGDTISGAEAQIDAQLVGGELTRRKQLGLYAGKIGTTVVVLQPRGDEDARRGCARGAVIVGLGELGDMLGFNELVETVRVGALRFMLNWLERGAGGAKMPKSLTLCSLLIGYNSTTHISIEDSLAAVTLGVCEANEQFAAKMGRDLCIGRLEFIDVYLDAAISAAHAAQRLTDRLARDLRRLSTRLEVDGELATGEGVRPRLEVSGGFGYWPRLMVTDGDRQDKPCPPECFEVRQVSPMQEENCLELLGEKGDGLNLLRKARQRLAGRRQTYPQRLHFLLMAERARAEVRLYQRQPGLIESLVEKTIHDTAFGDSHRNFCRTLFQLMVPVELKPAARQMERLALVVDGYTANLPWEMLLADDEPLVLRMKLVRQLASPSFRQQIRPALENVAYVVGNPSTAGYAEAFPDPDRPDAKDPASLTGAQNEAEKVVETLMEAGFQRHNVVQAIGPEMTGEEVIGQLYSRPFRILHIAAHGVFQAIGRDGRLRSGAILSGGLLLTAAEVGQMEMVPELVFLNCCHLGQVNLFPADANRLASSLAREFIEMGVRCVIAAGWAVDDNAAQNFAERFYEAILKERRPFGEAVFEARKSAYWTAPGRNTWGAYQAYGDPGHVMATGSVSRGGDDGGALVSPEELLDRIERLRIDAKGDKRHDGAGSEGKLGALLANSPPSWRGRPGVLAALGRFYAELGTAFFDKAQAAYLGAIAAEDREGRVPILAIERLANLESRTGQEKGGKEGLVLVNRAIQRLEALVAIGKDAKDAGLSERYALLGSAWKSKAVVLKRQRATVSAIKKALETSRDYYARGQGDSDGVGDFDPYALLNRLQLEGVLGVPGGAVAPMIQAARRCAERTRETYAKSGNFFDAVMSADAVMAELLLDGALVNKKEDLKKTYTDAVAGVPKSGRQFNSTVRQLRLLGELLERVQSGRGDDAKALREVADSLEALP